jgi:hypothetical protein
LDSSLASVRVHTTPAAQPSTDVVKQSIHLRPPAPPRTADPASPTPVAAAPTPVASVAPVAALPVNLNSSNEPISAAPAGTPVVVPTPAPPATVPISAVRTPAVHKHDDVSGDQGGHERVGDN